MHSDLMGMRGRILCPVWTRGAEVGVGGPRRPVEGFAGIIRERNSNTNTGNNENLASVREKYYTKRESIICAYEYVDRGQCMRSSASDIA